MSWDPSAPRPSGWAAPGPTPNAPNAQPGPYAQASPYAQPGQYAQPLVGYGVPAAPPVARRRSMGAGWLIALTCVASVLGLVALLVVPVLVGGGAYSAGAVLGGPQTLSDPQHRVSIEVPGGWDDVTTPQAGTDVDRGKEQGYRIPDVETSSTYGTSYLAMLVFDRQLTSGAQEHMDYVDGVCADLGCTARGRVETIQINGHQAYQQVLTHPMDPEWGTDQTMITTIRTPHLLTVFEGYFTEDDAAGRAEVTEVVGTVTIRD